jgi:hypothetical protein
LNTHSTSYNTNTIEDTLFVTAVDRELVPCAQAVLDSPVVSCGFKPDFLSSGSTVDLSKITDSCLTVCTYDGNISYYMAKQLFEFLHSKLLPEPIPFDVNNVTDTNKGVENLNPNHYIDTFENRGDSKFELLSSGTPINIINQASSFTPLRDASVDEQLNRPMTPPIMSAGEEEDELMPRSFTPTTYNTNDQNSPLVPQEKIKYDITVNRIKGSSQSVRSMADQYKQLQIPEKSSATNIDICSSRQVDVLAISTSPPIISDTRKMAGKPAKPVLVSKPGQRQIQYKDRSAKQNSGKLIGNVAVESYLGHPGIHTLQVCYSYSVLIYIISKLAIPYFFRLHVLAYIFTTYR